MGKLYNKYGEVIGYTDGDDRTDYSSAAASAKVGGKYQSTSSGGGSNFDLSGLSGYALEYAKAANKGAKVSGKGRDEADEAASVAIGGSGLSGNDISSILAGGGMSTSYRPGQQQALNQPASFGGSGFDMESILAKLGNTGYTPLSEAEMLAQAKTYADLQLSPLLAALQGNYNTSKAAQEAARGGIEAAYSGVSDTVNRRLDQASRQATQDAIARGMGRSGVVNWERAKLSEPILQQEAQAMQEKAAKMSGVDLQLAAMADNYANQQNELQQRLGLIESNRLAELQNMNQQNSLGYNQNQQSLMMSLLPLFLYG
ncbi:MAG: hypothetical protein M0P69_14545 [Bacteroidales bacterium]|jgi:hypothetical protein|nr:hypothetical protein [Bacteroidales bacterium]